MGFPGDLNGKESACNAGDPGSIPGLGRFHREGNGNPLQYSCLENPMDREAWLHYTKKGRRSTLESFSSFINGEKTLWFHGPYSMDVSGWLITYFVQFGLGMPKGTTEDEMAGWRHWLYGRESEWTPGVGDGQGGLACCDSWGRKESDTTERLNWTEPWPHHTSSATTTYSLLPGFSDISEGKRECHGVNSCHTFLLSDPLTFRIIKTGFFPSKLVFFLEFQQIFRVDWLIPHDTPQGPKRGHIPGNLACG